MRLPCVRLSLVLVLVLQLLVFQRSGLLWGTLGRRARCRPATSTIKPHPSCGGTRQGALMLMRLRGLVGMRPLRLLGLLALFRLLLVGGLMAT